jgi:hypothetical protein
VCAVVVFAQFAIGCGGAGQSQHVGAQYDQQTGRLQRITYDSNANGRPDTFSEMDGSRVVKIEIDKDEDGKIDRWEHYDAQQKLEKVGISRANDGKEDAWSYADADGSISRVDFSTARDGKVTRSEFYEKEAVVRAEEDGDGDGRIDKWETYDSSGRLLQVAFDADHRGSPSQRLTYRADGSVRAEVDPDGTGQWRTASDSR